MILVDTGPLVAFIIKSDPHRERVARAFMKVSGQLLTTDACITETLYFLGQAEGWQAQARLRDMLRTGNLIVRAHDETGPLQAFEYMERYSDIPCDYADATLIIAADETRLRRILTLDKHFHAYRLLDGSPFEVIP